MPSDKKMNVLFRDNDATVYVNQIPPVRKFKRKWYAPKTWKAVAGEDDILIENADLQFVYGVSPHYWKLVEGVILPMNAEEKAKNDNVLHKIQKSYVVKQNATKQQMIMGILLGFVVGMLTGWTIK
jgi:hypothetical protein